MLLSKIRDLENEARYKLNRRDTDKMGEDLKSKLKAAETLCESLMDENEDMKKEIRELEEEICEMQDNFRYLLTSYSFIKIIKVKRNIFL